MEHDLAQILSFRALGWLAGEEELWQGFLGSSGADAAQVRAAAAAGDAALSRAVLDYLMQSDATVLACAAALGVGPQDLVSAQAVLAGPAGMHWT